MHDVLILLARDWLDNLFEIIKKHCRLATQLIFTPHVCLANHLSVYVCLIGLDCSIEPLNINMLSKYGQQN